MRKLDWDYCVVVIYVIGFRFHQSSCLDLGLFFMFNAWLTSPHLLLLSLFLIIQSIWSPRGKNIEFSLPQMDCCDFFLVIPQISQLATSYLGAIDLNIKGAASFLASTAHGEAEGLT